MSEEKETVKPALRITKIGVSAGITYNLGKFNSLRFDSTFEAEVEEGANAGEQLRLLSLQARKQTEQELAKFLAQALDTKGVDFDSQPLDKKK